MTMNLWVVCDHPYPPQLEKCVSKQLWKTNLLRKHADYEFVGVCDHPYPLSLNRTHLHLPLTVLKPPCEYLSYVLTPPPAGSHCGGYSDTGHCVWGGDCAAQCCRGPGALEKRWLPHLSSSQRSGRSPHGNHSCTQGRGEYM